VAVTHLAVVEMLRADAFHVYEFSGATKVTERHQSIRDFQASGQAKSGQAKVFVITMKTGAVGVTLTAATRVYLMEPVRAERLQPGCCSCPLATVSALPDLTADRAFGRHRVSTQRWRCRPPGGSTGWGRTRTYATRGLEHGLTGLLLTRLSLAIGQVLITRFAFRDSLESNICALHDKMKSPSSSVVVTDGVLPAAAVRLLDER